MPILDVEVVGTPLPHVRRGLAQRIADETGQVFQSAPQNTWVKVHFVEPEQYAENGGPPGEMLPVFVTVIQAEHPPANELAAQVALLTAAVARACHRSDDCIHVLYDPPAAGRIAFGGRLRL